MVLGHQLLIPPFGEEGLRFLVNGVWDPSILSIPRRGMFLAIDNLNFSAFGVSSYFAFYDGAAAAANIEYGINVQVGGVVDIIENGVLAAAGVFTMSLGVNYDLVIVLDSNLNAHYFIRAGTDDFQLIWVGVFATGAVTVHAEDDNTGATYTTNVERFGLGFPNIIPQIQIDGAVAAGTGSIAGSSPLESAMADADFLMQFTLTTLPSAGQAIIRFRYLNATRYWRIVLFANANFNLNEFISGALGRATAPGVLASGQVIRLTTRGKIIEAFYDTTNAWSYAAADNFLRQLDWDIEALGTGGVISDFRRWNSYARQEDGRGAELVTNGDFDADSDWVKGAGWTIAAGVASCDGTQVADSDLAQAGVLTSGMYTEVIFTISNYSAGNLAVLGGTIQLDDKFANGTFTQGIIPDGTGFALRADLDFIGDVEIVEAKEILFTPDALGDKLNEAVA